MRAEEETDTILLVVGFGYVILQFRNFAQVCQHSQQQCCPITGNIITALLYSMLSVRLHGKQPLMVYSAGLSKHMSFLILLKVELAKGGARRGARGGGYGGGFGGGISRRSKFRVRITGLPKTCSWQDLKDYARKAGDVTFANVSSPRRSSPPTLLFLYPGCLSV